jgi:hypothetical protein
MWLLRFNIVYSNISHPLTHTHALTPCLSHRLLHCIYTIMHSKSHHSHVHKYSRSTPSFIHSPSLAH